MLQRDAAEPKSGSQHEARRAQILDAARIAFARSGFHGASVQDICAEARMSPGALYRYFPSKEAIIEAIAEDERCGAAEIVHRMRGPGDLLTRMVDCAIAYFSFLRDPDASGLMVEICAESMRNSAVGQRFARIDDDVRMVIREILAEAVARGEIPPIADVEATISILTAAVDGIALRQVADNDLSPDRVEPLLRRLIAGVLGVRPGDPA